MTFIHKMLVDGTCRGTNAITFFRLPLVSNRNVDFGKYYICHCVCVVTNIMSLRVVRWE